MTDALARRYGIRELAQASGVSRRTIHFYVQRGLLSPPQGAGRGHYYVPAHLEALLRIRQMQDEGRTLEEIRALSARRGTAQAVREPLPEMAPATLIRLRDGVDLLVHSWAAAPTPSQLRALAAAAAEILGRRK